MTHRNECEECGRRFVAFFRSVLCIFCTEARGLRYPITCS